MKLPLFLLASALLLGACDTAQPPVTSVLLITQDASLEEETMNADTKKSGNAHSGTFYSSIDATRQFGAGRSLKMPDSLKGKRLVVYVSAWVREPVAPFEGGLAMQLDNAQGTVKFKLYKPADAQATGQWVQISDSAKFGAQSLKGEKTELKIYGYKNAGTDSLDIDDIKINYKFY